ncbi:Aspyridones efflux protein [Lachnellula subtilissima]|uniref:Aspyridones efflux protein n=1 Tax=Lachnellula subtilissima TaxID=602034 RepID=A0A8H8RWA1_9HELO|nr:Aspyridones efflux protein [Lachnellula subtilissima]
MDPPTHQSPAHAWAAPDGIASLDSSQTLEVEEKKKGISNTFGAYQTYYETGLLAHESPSNISWIGSIQAFLLLFVGGLITGPIYDAGYLRGLVITGSALGVTGMMMTSICKEYWQVVLAQGVLVGCGSGCLMMPSVAVMPQYFTKRRAFATGIGAAGSSLGGVIYPIVFHQLQPRIGFGWATRVIAFIMLATLMIPILVMRVRVFPSTRRPLFDKNILRSIPYDLFSLGEFFGFMGMYIPFYYVTSYSIEHNIANENISFYLLTFLNVGSIFGRIVPNFFADITGPLNITFPFILLCSVIAFSWTSVHSLGQMVLFCLFYGCFSGTFVSITGPALATLSNDMSLVGTHMGMSFTFGALGLLVGNPVAGVLLKKGWIAPATFCGAANILAALCILGARVKKAGWTLKVKV